MSLSYTAVTGGSRRSIEEYALGCESDLGTTRTNTDTHTELARATFVARLLAGTDISFSGAFDLLEKGQADTHDQHEKHLCGLTHCQTRRVS